MGPPVYFIQECQTDNLFEPILWEEEDGRQLVIGFRVNGQPQFILSDAQYSKKENGAPLMMMMTDAPSSLWKLVNRFHLLVMSVLTMCMQRR